MLEVSNKKTDDTNWPWIMKLLSIPRFLVSWIYQLFYSNVYEIPKTNNSTPIENSLITRENNTVNKTLEKELSLSNWLHFSLLVP